MWDAALVISVKGRGGLARRYGPGRIRGYGQGLIGGYGPAEPGGQARLPGVGGKRAVPDPLTICFRPLSASSVWIFVVPIRDGPAEAFRGRRSAYPCWLR